jgi:hypothetical protein
MFVITVIRYITVKTILMSRHLGPKMGHYFVSYKREFIITIIVITEFDSISFLSALASQLKEFCIN